MKTGWKCGMCERECEIRVDAYVDEEPFICPFFFDRDPDWQPAEPQKVCPTCKGGKAILGGDPVTGGLKLHDCPECKQRKGVADERK